MNPNNPARWFEPDSNQPVVFYVNPTGAPAFADLEADMQAAMNAWSTAGGSIRATFGGLTGGCGVYVADGVNTISFNNCDGYFPPSQGCAGLIAVSGIVNYVPDETKSVGGISYCKAVEANMSFNPYGLCNYRNRTQLQEVATHEIGHALGLGHSSEPNATSAIHPSRTRRWRLMCTSTIEALPSCPTTSKEPSPFIQQVRTAHS